MDLLRSLLMPCALVLLGLAVAAGWYGRSLGAEVRLLQREGVEVQATITRKWEQVPSRSDGDGTERAGIPTYWLYLGFTDPGDGAEVEVRSAVARDIWEAAAVSERRELLVVPGRPEVHSLFGVAGLGRAAGQLDRLATWMGFAALVCLALDFALRRRARRQS